MSAVAPRFDSLPTPPSIRIGGVQERARDRDIERFLQESRRQANEQLQEARAYQGYVRELQEKLDSLCRLAESAEAAPDTVRGAIAELYRRERQRAEAAIPCLEILRSRPAQLRAFDKRFALPWLEAGEAWDGAITAELEAFRDARLRLEKRLADLINNGRPGVAINSDEDLDAFFEDLAAE